MSKWGRKQRPPPEGFDFVEPTLNALDIELRERVNDPHDGKRKTEAQWPVHQINWQKSRYVYELFWKYHRISREVYEYCIDQKLVDGALIAKWRKPGYERLCSTYVINPANFKFGTSSICRVPKSSLPEGTVIEDPVTGCMGCASGGGAATKNIFGNKYGQPLAAIQVAREKRQEQQRLEREQQEREDAEREAQEAREQAALLAQSRSSSSSAAGGAGAGGGAGAAKKASKKEARLAREAAAAAAAVMWARDEREEDELVAVADAELDPAAHHGVEASSDSTSRSGAGAGGSSSSSSASGPSLKKQKRELA